MSSFPSSGICLVMGGIISLLLPLFVSIFIFKRYGRIEVARFAGWMTLKPYAATPLWLCCNLALSFAIPDRTQWVLVVLIASLPALSLTGLIVWRYRHLFHQGQVRPLSALLAADLVRWGSSLSAVNTPLSERSPDLALSLLALGAAMPALYAMLAWALVSQSDAAFG